MKLHILIGPARSGKTTFIHQHMTDKDAHISVTQNDVFIERASKEAIHGLFGFKNDKTDNFNQLPPTEVGGLFLSSVVERLKADSLPKDSVLWPYTFYTLK